MSTATANVVDRPRVLSGRIPFGARFVVSEQLAQPVVPVGPTAEEKQVALLARLRADQKRNTEVVEALVAASCAAKAAKLAAEQEAAELAAFEPHLTAARRAAVDALVAVWKNDYPLFLITWLSRDQRDVLESPGHPLTLAQARARWAALPGIYLASANASR